MIPGRSFDGKRVALFGLGGSGTATARALVEGGAEVVPWDDNPDSVAKAAGEGIPTGDLRTEDWSGFASFVLSPGVPLTHPKPHWTVELARGAGVEIIGDVELFCRERALQAPDAPFIAITGTNGKSTTTALTAHILKAAGRDAQMGGNIGRAVMTLDPPKSDRYYVVECSSYQIDLAPSIDPTAGILLNMTHDHLDACLAFLQRPRVFAFTSHATQRYTDTCFADGDALLFGRETSGLSDEVLATVPESQRLRLPMQPDNRSLNLSNAVAIAVYEAWRQLGFPGASDCDHP